MLLLLLVAKQLAILSLLLLTAMGAGVLALGGGEGIGLPAAAGLALCGHAWLLLAAIGQLRAAPVIVLAIIAIIGGAIRFRPREWPAASRIAACIAVIAPLFALTLYPPLAFDETLYHLPFVRALARDGALRFLPALRFPVFPQFHELLCVPVFLVGGDTATHLVALGEVILTAVLLIEWGKRHDARAGGLAAALFLGSPIVVQLSSITYADAALTLFVAAGFYALDRERFALAGLFLGTACSVKYLGGYFVIAALLVVVARTAGRRRDAAAFLIACAAAALPSTAWIVLKTHDPVFPFYGSSLWVLPGQPALSLADRAVRALRTVWDVTFARHQMGGEPPMTPLLIAMVGVVVAAAIRNRRARWVAMLCAVYVAVFTYLPQDSRYLVPLLPLLSVTAAVTVAARWAKATALLALLAIAPGVAYAGYRIVLLGVPPVTASQRSAWLARRVPAYPAVLRAGQERVYVCGGEQLKDYAGGELLGDFAGPFSYERILAGANDSATIARRLRSIDAAYLLVVKSKCQSPIANGGMALAYEDSAAQLWRVQPPSSR